MPTLKQFVEQAAKRASQIFEKQGSLRPMYHAVDGGPAVMLRVVMAR
jgi:hypothetical protein